MLAVMLFLALYTAYMFAHVSMNCCTCFPFSKQNHMPQQRQSSNKRRSNLTVHVVSYEEKQLKVTLKRLNIMV